MPLENNIFPQSGDKDDAARFAQLIGQKNLLDFVEEGLNVTADFSSQEATVSEGLCFISQKSDEATSDSKTIRSLGYAIQVAETTVAIESGDNYLFVVPDLNTNDTNSIEVYSDPDSAPESSLHIATVHTDTESIVEANRGPTAYFDSVEIENDLSFPYGLDFDDEVTFNNTIFSSSGEKIWDDVNDYIPQPRLENDSITVTGENGISGGSVKLGESVTVDIDGDLSLDQNLLSNLGTVIWDNDTDQIPFESLDTDTVASKQWVENEVGDGVSELGDRVDSNESDIDDLNVEKLDVVDYTPEEDTHDRYTDTEAVAAVDDEISAAANSISGLDNTVSSNESDIGDLKVDKLDVDDYKPEEDTHDRYTDTEALDTVNSEISAAANSVNSLDSQVASNESNIDDLKVDKLDVDDYNPEEDTHDRYTDEEALSAVNSEISAAANSISSLDSQVASNESDIGSLESSVSTAESDIDDLKVDKLDVDDYNPEEDTHDRYTDTEALSAVDAEVSNYGSVSALDEQVSTNESELDTHNHDGRYVRLFDGAQFPVYSSEEDVPEMNTGEAVVVENDGIYVEI